MSTSFNIHSDFHAIKAREFSLNRLVLALLTTFLRIVNAIHRRKFKSILARRKLIGEDGARFPVLVVTPENLTRPAPALVYFHGGAFVMKPAPQHIENAVRYAREANCVVVFVEYRLAPAHPFPAGFNDCYTALRWTLDNTSELGIDPHRVAVGGDSAGGAMAAGVAQRARQEDGIDLCGQLLVYPVTDLQCQRPSVSAYADVPPFKAASPNEIMEIYLGHPLAEGIPRYASPIAGDLAGLAPAYVELAQFDILHDQGLDYAHALQAKGIDVDLDEVAGAVHGFDLLAPDSGISQAAVQNRIGFLRKVFSN